MPNVLKCWTEFFDAVKSNEKTFEIRAMSPGEEPNIGEVLFLADFDPLTQKLTGRVLGFVVTYKLQIADSDAALSLPFPKTGQPVWVFGGYPRIPPKLVQTHEDCFYLMGYASSEKFQISGVPNASHNPTAWRMGIPALFVEVAMNKAVEMAPDVDRTCWLDHHGEVHSMPIQSATVCKHSPGGEDFEECLNAVNDERR